MSNIHNLQSENNDDALVHRLLDLTLGDSSDCDELARIDTLVYARLTEAYGEDTTVASPPDSQDRVAA